MKTYKWGVIGCGGIARRRTIPEFISMASNAEIMSVMDISKDVAEDVAKEFNASHFCDKEEELLSQDIDAVYIATPQDKHCEQVLKAASAGKHILCEKPITITLDEVKQMDEAIKKAGVKFMLGFCMRNNVYNQKAREIVSTQKLGRMVMARAQLTCWYPPIEGAWRQDIKVSHGGCLIDMGTHCIDLLEWIMDTKIKSVCGFQDRLVHEYPTEIEDTSTIAVAFENGAHGIIDNYFNLPDAAAQNALELHGTKGSIVGQGTIGQDPTGNMFSVLQSEETGYNANQVRNVDVQRDDYKLEGKGIYGRMIEDFVKCIEDDSIPPVTLEDGKHSVQVVNAIYKAVKEKRTVDVEEIK